MLNLSPYHEICQIPHEIRRISWSTTKCCIRNNIDIHYWLIWDTSQTTYYMLNMQCTSPCHEIRQISWNPPDSTWSWNPPNFMVLYFSSEPIQIYKSLPWNLPDFMVLYFSSEPIQIYNSLPWNPPNFTMKSGGFHGHWLPNELRTHGPILLRMVWVYFLPATISLRK